MNGLSFSRTLVDRMGLQTEKMCIGEGGPGVSDSFGTKNSNKVYTPFVSAVSSRSPDTRTYVFRVQDLLNGLVLCPVELRFAPPPCIAELMGITPV